MDEEARLIRALRRRDRAAWGLAYDRHIGAVFGVVFHLVGGDRAVAEDVHQEVWLLAIEQVDRFDPARGEFRAWLLGIARHRAARRWRERTTVPDARAEGLADVPTPNEILEEAERADLVRAALLTLRDDWRRVLLAKYAEGQSVAAIAAASGRSAKAVESLLARARAQFRALIQPYFSTTTGADPHEASDARPRP